MTNKTKTYISEWSINMAVLAVILLAFKFIPGSPGNEFNLLALLIPIWLPISLFLATALIAFIVDLFIDLIYRKER